MGRVRRGHVNMLHFAAAATSREPNHRGTGKHSQVRSGEHIFTAVEQVNAGQISAKRTLFVALSLSPNIAEQVKRRSGEQKFTVEQVNTEEVSAKRSLFVALSLSSTIGMVRRTYRSPTDTVRQHLQNDANSQLPLEVESAEAASSIRNGDRDPTDKSQCTSRFRTVCIP